MSRSLALVLSNSFFFCSLSFLALDSSSEEDEESESLDEPLLEEDPLPDDEDEPSLSEKLESLISESNGELTFLFADAGFFIGV